MSNIRIKDLTTTAATTASDDFIAVDGTTNGTRKLNAYSPTFGGNLTVSGNIVSIGASGSGTGGNVRVVDDGGTTRWIAGLLGSVGARDYSIYDVVTPREVINISSSTGLVTLAGNLTVSGTGTSSFAGVTSASGGSINITSSDPAVRLKASGTVVADGNTFEVRNVGVSGTNFLQFRTVNDANSVFTTRMALWNSGGLYLGTDPVGAGNPGAGNMRLSGNLTVSGTGTSSFESTTPPTVAIQNTTSGLSATQTVANGVLLGTLKFGHPNDAQSGNFPSIVGRFSLSDASFARCTALDFYTSSASGNARVGTFTELGNLLIGTTTDSGNGKLQLTSHTTSAGGIGFGTDWGIYRKSQYTLGLNVASGAKPLFFYTDVTNVGLFDQADVNTTTGWSGYYITPGDKALKLATNNTTALTLDSSQNATFAGSIKTVAPSGGTAKPWELGEAATVSPTSPNRTIRVEIDGTVYYIHAKTTND